MFAPAHNRSDAAVVVDPDGRQIAAGEWGVVDDALEEVTEAAGAGRLALYRAAAIDDGPGQNPDAVTAARAAEAAEERRSALAGMPEAHVAELAQRALGMEPDPDGDTAAALRGLALSTVELVPAPAGPETKRPPAPEPEPQSSGTPPVDEHPQA